MSSGCVFVLRLMHRVLQARGRVEATQAVLHKAAQYNAKVENATAKLNADLAASEHQAELAKLRDLIALNEALKLQEAQFKANCGRQRTALRVRRHWSTSPHNLHLLSIAHFPRLRHVIMAAVAGVMSMSFEGQAVTITIVRMTRRFELSARMRTGLYFLQTPAGDRRVVESAGDWGGGDATGRD